MLFLSLLLVGVVGATNSSSLINIQTQVLLHERLLFQEGNINI